MTPSVQFWALQAGLPALGLALLIAGFGTNQPLMLDAGLLSLAAAGVSTGLACIVGRRVVFLHPADRYQLLVWHGPAAVLVGASYVVLGLTAAGAGVAHASGMSAAAIRNAILVRPWLVLVPSGLAMLTRGMSVMVGFEEGRDRTRGAWWNRLMSIPSILGGFILAAAGGAVLVVGVCERLRPDAFDRALDALSRGWPGPG